MPQALKHLCLIQFWNWKNTLFLLLALWGNKNWPPSIKMREIGNFQNKMGLKGYKWSNLNAPGTQMPLPHVFLELEELPFSHIPQKQRFCEDRSNIAFNDMSTGQAPERAHANNSTRVRWIPHLEVSCERNFHLRQVIYVCRIPGLKVAGVQPQAQFLFLPISLKSVTSVLLFHFSHP